MHDKEFIIRLCGHRGAIGDRFNRFHQLPELTAYISLSSVKEDLLTVDELTVVVNYPPDVTFPF
jgi:hypothetical protein